MALPLGLAMPQPPQAPPGGGLAAMLAGGGPPPGPDPSMQDPSMGAPPQGMPPSLDQQQVPPTGAPTTDVMQTIQLLAPYIQQKAADTAQFAAQQAQAEAAAFAIAMQQEPNPLAAASPTLPGEPTAPGGFAQ